MTYQIMYDDFNSMPRILASTVNRLDALAELEYYTKFYQPLSFINPRLVYMVAKEEKEDEQK